jgi:serine/threonine protein kinase
MGQVYRAKDTRLGRTVAIKILNKEHMQRFEQEARAIAALNHSTLGIRSLDPKTVYTQAHSFMVGVHALCESQMTLRIEPAWNQAIYWILLESVSY